MSLKNPGYIFIYIYLPADKKIKTIDHFDLILSGIHIHPRPHVTCKFGKDIQRNKATVIIIVKEAKIV